MLPISTNTRKKEEVGSGDGEGITVGVGSGVGVGDGVGVGVGVGDGVGVGVGVGVGDGAGVGVGLQLIPHRGGVGCGECAVGERLVVWGGVVGEVGWTVAVEEAGMSPRPTDGDGIGGVGLLTEADGSLLMMAMNTTVKLRKRAMVAARTRNTTRLG